MPIPLAMMIPFMAAQSMLMGDAFGRSFQYGKRKISAMSNEEFNAYDESALVNELFKNYNALIPPLKEMIADSKDFQVFIFAHLLDMPRDLLSQLFGAVFPKDETPTAPKDTEHKFLSPKEILQHQIHGHLGGTGQQVGKPEEPVQPPSQGNNPNVTQTDVSKPGLPKAGPQQISDRNGLIQKIANLATALGKATKAPQKTNIKNSIKVLQAKLTKLLESFNWI